MQIQVTSLLAKPTQNDSGEILNSSPHVVIDPIHYYVSARFPGDAERFGEILVDVLREAVARH